MGYAILRMDVPVAGTGISVACLPFGAKAKAADWLTKIP